MDVFYALGERLPPTLTIFEENIEKECRIIGKKPKAVVNAAVLFAIFSFVVSFPVFLLLGFPLLSVLIAIFGFYYKYNQVNVEAIQAIMEAQNEIIFASLLLAIYIRINRNLEGAIKFAGRSAKGIVADIMRRVSWSVEMREESNVEKALDKHAPILRELDDTFIKVLELLKMSISEKQSARFEDIIDKALSLQLASTNEKMQRYVEAISNPVKLIFSFLMLFPMMLLIMIPIVGIFLGSEIPPSLLFIVFDIAIPLVAYYYVTTILAKRPGTLAVHITPEIREKYGGIRIGESVFSPIVAVAIFLAISIPFLGILALNFGLFESAALVYIAAIAIGIYHFGRSYGLMDRRSKISEMDKDFRASLKELAVVLRQNIPIENAIAMMVEEGRKIGTLRKGAVDLWGKILEKIKIEGKTLKGAIFGRDGVIKEYPSVMISDILYVISESAEKGPRQTAVSTIKAAEYLDRTFEINARINEMLSEITNTVSMMSKFIMPLVGGVAVAFGDLIAKFIIVMSKKVHGAEGFGIFSFGGGAVFSSVDMQLIIGTYVLEMLVILGMFENGIKQGYDEVGRDYTIAKNIFIGFTVYIISLIASWALLNFLISGIAI
jgi:hypothetical protein